MAIAARKQDDKSYLIFTVDAAGKIAEFELEDVAYARIKLESGKSRVTALTDVAWADGRVIAAGRGSETLDAKVRKRAEQIRTRWQDVPTVKSVLGSEHRDEEEGDSPEEEESTGEE